MNDLMGNYLYVLVAPSAVGKSALLSQMKDEGLWALLPKYSTRDNRSIDDDVITINDEVVQKAQDYCDRNQTRAVRVTFIRNICGDGKGLIYNKNGNIYAVDISSANSQLMQSSLAVIISDFRVIKKLKAVAGLENRVRVIYIASTIDESQLYRRIREREDKSKKPLDDGNDRIRKIQNLANLLVSATRLRTMEKVEEVLPLLTDEWNHYMPYLEEAKARAFNMRMLYNKYMDNIATIDRVILNIKDLDFMYEQARNIIAFPHSRKPRISPPLFLICATPASGKATLMEIVADLSVANPKIVILNKYAKRSPRITDKRDGMIAIGTEKEFNDFIKNPEDIWRWLFHKGEASDGVEYAIDRSEIDRNISFKHIQFFISNFEQIEKARTYYPDNLVVLYLHATHDSAMKNHISLKRRNEIEIEIIKTYNTNDGARIDAVFDQNYKGKHEQLVINDLKEINEIQTTYLKYINEVDHVLLNTGTREDLAEQITNLIEHYQ